MPAAWDRLADATQAAVTKLPLSVVTLGHVHSEDLVALTPHSERVEQLVLDVAPHDPFSKHRAELNRAIDAGTADWLLIVREREQIDDALAGEIASAMTAGGARGFRIRSVPLYRGLPLRLETGGGEVRLFHRRYYLRYANKGEWQELSIQGTVVRLENVFRSITFASAEEHRSHLATRGAKRSPVGRSLRFAQYVLGTRSFDRNTLAYLWAEAAYEVEERRPPADFTSGRDA